VEPDGADGAGNQRYGSRKESEPERTPFRSHDTVLKKSRGILHALRSTQQSRRFG
jgi:hypothetical protein